MKTAHEVYHSNCNFSSVYAYDSANDGPEVEVITRILASHPWIMSITDIRTPMVVERHKFFPKGD